MISRHVSKVFDWESLIAGAAVVVVVVLIARAGLYRECSKMFREFQRFSVHQKKVFFSGYEVISLVLHLIRSCPYSPERPGTRGLGGPLCLRTM